MKVSQTFFHSAFTDTDLDSENLTKADLENCKSLQDFFKHHSDSSQYVFQLKNVLVMNVIIVLNTLFSYQHLPSRSCPISLYLCLMLQKNITKNLMIYMAQCLDEWHQPSYSPIPSDKTEEEDKKNKGKPKYVEQQAAMSARSQGVCIPTPD